MFIISASGIQIWREFKFGDVLTIRQTAKLKSPPNFPAIRYIHSSNCINFSTLLLSQTNPWVHGWELSNVSMKCISSLVPRLLHHFLGQAGVHPGVCSKIVHKAMVRPPNRTCLRFELAHPLLQAESSSVQAYNQKQIHHFSIPIFLPPSSS